MLHSERDSLGPSSSIRLKNKLTQRAIAKECAEWIRRKAQFRSNLSGAPMQQFACLKSSDGQETVYLPLHGFTAVSILATNREMRSPTSSIAWMIQR